MPAGQFQLLSIQRQLTIRTAKFLQAFAASENRICLLFNSIATHQLNIIMSSFSVTSTGQLINVIYDQVIYDLLRAMSVKHIQCMTHSVLTIYACVRERICS